MKKVALGFLGVLLFGVAAAQAAPRELRLAVFFPEQSSTVREVLRPWAEWVEKQVGDEVKVVIHAGGALGRDPAKQLKLLEDNVADISFINLAFTRGRFPESSLFELPLMIHDVAEGTAAIWKMHEKGLIRGVESVRVLSLNTSPTVVLHATKPIAKLEDIKGWKIRSGGSTENRMLGLLGAAPVAVQPAQIAEGLSRNLIQAALLDWNALQTFKVSEVAEYHYDAALGGVLSFMIAMNKDVYESLSPKVKKVMDSSGPFINERHVAAFSASVKRSREAAEKQRPDGIVRPGKGEEAELEKLFAPLHDEWKKQYGAEHHDALVSILKEIRR
jgi:TRAP-type C4-dicarboxylate transport system substrate-binding protein